MQTHEAVAHFALDFRPRHQRRHGVHHHHVDGAGTHQRLGDLQRLLAGVGLGDEHVLDLHAQSAGIGGIQRVLGVHKGHLAALFLRLRQNVQRQRGLAGGFRPVDLDDAPLGHAADAQRHVQRQRAGGDGLHVHLRAVAKAHDRALTEVLVDLGKGRLQCLFLVRRGGGGFINRFLCSHNQSSFLPYWASTARSLSL